MVKTIMNLDEVQFDDVEKNGRTPPSAARSATTSKPRSSDTIFRSCPLVKFNVRSTATTARRRCF
jgi:hypothetical protein